VTSTSGHLARHALAAARGRRPPFALCYHGLGPVDPATDPHGLMITPETFAAQLEMLLARGYRLVSIAELWTAIADGGAGGGEGLGAITFDDGLAETLHTATALLRERGATATAFLAPGLFGQDHPDLPPGRRILRADEVREVSSAFLIGAHSHSHVALPDLAPDEQLEELRRSRAELEALVGAPVTTMAYPFGRSDAPPEALAARAGYAIACANSGAGAWRALGLPREPVFPSTSPLRLRVKVAGLYGPALKVRERTRPR
jgi:peptidoglycan/xylan/chitin deacetylase (PgdA/CDA1 family)